MFYMAIRYDGSDANTNALELTDDESLIVTGSRYMGKLSTLLQWHAADPPSAAAELARLRPGPGSSLAATHARLHGPQRHSAGSFAHAQDCIRYSILLYVRAPRF